MISKYTFFKLIFKNTFEVKLWMIITTSYEIIEVPIFVCHGFWENFEFTQINTIIYCYYKYYYHYYYE